MIEINNLTKITVDKKFLQGVAKIVLKGENIKKETETSIALIKESEIKKINQKYRKKNKATDVLSFNFGKGLAPHHQNLVWGLAEIVICPSQVKRNAKKYKVTFKKELARVLIHGILHILGYNHERSKIGAKKMEAKQEYYLSKLSEPK